MLKQVVIEAIEQLEGNENQTRFSKLLKICENIFGNCRINGSHHIFKTPWQGDPRINLQKVKGNFAKPYQVQQVLRALRKLNAVQEGKRNEQGDEKTK